MNLTFCQSECSRNSADCWTKQTKVQLVRFAHFLAGRICLMSVPALCILRWYFGQVENISVQWNTVCLPTGPNVLWSSKKFRGHCSPKEILSVKTFGLTDFNITELTQAECKYCTFQPRELITRIHLDLEGPYSNYSDAEKSRSACFDWHNCIRTGIKFET